MKPNEDNVKIKLNDKPKRRTDDPFALFVSMFADFLVQEIGPLSDSYLLISLSTQRNADLA